MEEIASGSWAKVLLQQVFDENFWGYFAHFTAHHYYCQHCCFLFNESTSKIEN
jgi:hypothetical protein